VTHEAAVPSDKVFEGGSGPRFLDNGDRDVTIRHSFAIALGILLSVGARAQAADEYRIKAAFLYNFAKFVEWPAQAFKSPSDPIVIGVLGTDPFGDALAEAVAGKTLGGPAGRRLPDRFRQLIGAKASGAPVHPDRELRGADSGRNG